MVAGKLIGVLKAVFMVQIGGSHFFPNYIKVYLGLIVFHRVQCTPIDLK